MPTPLNKGFRADINFLRAIAVLTVVLFHFRVNGFAGGFIGVDVFFVISGFLMTKIIVTGIEKQSFSVTRFYLARCKRIIPALLILCVILLIIGWFYLLPSEYRLLAKHVASSVGFLSNYIYLGEAGYFDPASHEKWLLHTWSLSVEWQFYLLYPLFLLILNRFFSRNNLNKLLVSTAMLSFSYMLYLGAIGHKSLYFGLFGRAWEMLCGGIVFLLPWQITHRVKQLLFYVGVGSIVCSAMLLDDLIIWPSAWTLVPIIGTMLVLYSANDEHWLTTNKLMTIIGRASYSIYLWHWPIVVSLSVFSFGFSALNIAIGMLLSGILGVISFWLVEQNGQRLVNASYIIHSTWRSLMLYAGLTGVVFGMAVLVFIKNGFAISARFEPAVLHADQEYLNRDPDKKQCLIEQGTKSAHCVYGDKNKPIAAILFGDSHASALVNVLTDSVEERGSVLFIARAGCLTVLNNHRIGKVDDSCAKFVSNELAYIQQQYSGVPVFMVNRWSYYLKGKFGEQRPLVYFTEPQNTEQPSNVALLAQQFDTALTQTFCELTHTNPLYVITPIPEFPNELPKQVAKALVAGNSGTITMSKTDYLQRNDIALSALSMAAQACQATVLAPTEYLCDQQTCTGAEAGQPWYYDDNHLSEFGNRRLLPMFTQIP